MSIHKRASTRGLVWRTQRQERRKKRFVNLIKCIITGLVACFAMATEQAALWLTWPALVWSLGYGAMMVDQLLSEGRYW